MEVKLFVSTKAFIQYRNKILILRESKEYKDGANIGKYEMPGGRIIPGQRFDKSLLREVKEETGLTIKIGKPFYVGEWHPIIRDEQWQIIAIFFNCEANTDEIRLSKEHDNYAWIDPREYKKYDMPSGTQTAFANYLENFVSC